MAEEKVLAEYGSSEDAAAPGGVLSDEVTVVDGAFLDSVVSVGSPLLLTSCRLWMPLRCSLDA